MSEFAKSPEKPFYVTGGTLPPDAPSYVERQADRDLHETRLAGETCYVLNSRQMGKSSLCVRALQRLKREGRRTAFLDLTKFGGRNLTAEQWYAALLSEAGRELGLRQEFLAHWKEHVDLPPVQRLFGALVEVGLEADASPIVVFIDEIDVTLGMPFSTDEFFAAIRQCYVGRAAEDRLKRISFCLLGTASPADLIQDTRVSPFNVGRRIELRDFTEAEASPLSAGLGGSGPLLARVLHWTGGHPYLTQRLCRAAQERGARTAGEVDSLCSALFLTHSARESDDNLAFVRNRLLKSEADLAALLDLYRQLREGRRVQDDETNPLCSILRLSGVAKMEQGLLSVRNRIYAHVFDGAWVESHLPDAELQRQRAAYRRGARRTLAIAGAVVALVGAFAIVALSQKLQSDANAVLARKNASLATAKAKEADGERQKASASARLASQNAAEANAQRNSAVAKSKEAADALTESVKQKNLANQSLIAAKSAKQDALMQAASARTEKQRADKRADDAEHISYNANMLLIPAAYELSDFARISELLGDSKTRRFRGFEWGYWNRLCHLDLMTFKGHTNWVMSVAFSSDGRRIATGSADLTAKVWDAETGRETLTLKGHTDAVASVAFSSDGRRIATGSDDNTAKVWEAGTGRETLTLKEHTNAVTSVAFSSDGRRIATGSWGNTAIIWLSDSDPEQPRMNAHEPYARHFASLRPSHKTASGKQLHPSGAKHE